MAVWSGVELANLSSDFRLDAEHYQPAYLRQEKAAAKLPRVALKEVAYVTDGNHLSIAEEFVEAGVRYLRGQDLSDFFISDTDPIYIPERTYDTLKRSHMLPGDVLVGIVGTIGSIGLVTKRHGKLTGNCKLAIVRARSLPAEYLAAYLASRVGQNEIQRCVRGAVQMGLILPDLKDLPVVVPSDAQRNAVVSIIQDAERSRERCRALVEEAENLVTDTLGLTHVDFSENLSYERKFSELIAASRFGAEYFMPCKQRVLDALARNPGRPLGALYRSVRELFNPAGANRDLHVRNFDLTDALAPVLDDRKEMMPAIEVGSTKKHFKPGDVVISRLRSYLRETALVRTSSNVPAIGSSEFIVLRPEDATKKGKLTPEALFVYLRSLPVQTVLKWSQDGSQHPRFDERDLLAIPVPDAVVRIAPKIDVLVNEALAARAQVTQRLDEAKAAIERAVLSGGA